MPMGDQPTMLQACEYLIAQHPDLIATNPTLPTITGSAEDKRHTCVYDGLPTS